MVHCGRPSINKLCRAFSYGSIGALLMSKKIADGIRDASGFWKHGHTYQVCPSVCYSMCETESSSPFVT